MRLGPGGVPRGPGIRSQVLQRRPGSPPPGAKPLMGTGKGATKGPGQLATPALGRGPGRRAEVHWGGLRLQMETFAWPGPSQLREGIEPEKS